MDHMPLPLSQCCWIRIRKLAATPPIGAYPHWHVEVEAHRHAVPERDAQLVQKHGIRHELESRGEAQDPIDGHEVDATVARLVRHARPDGQGGAEEALVGPECQWRTGKLKLEPDSDDFRVTESRVTGVTISGVIMIMIFSASDSESEASGYRDVRRAPVTVASHWQQPGPSLSGCF